MLSTFKLTTFVFILALLTLFACGGGSNEQQNIEKENPTDSSANTEATASETSEAQTTENAENLTSEDATQQQQKAEGTFVQIEQGDYFYFIIKGESEEEMSFMILQGDATFDAVNENPDAYVGKKVTVYYEISKENIPEAGGEIEVEKYIKAEFAE